MLVHADGAWQRKCTKVPGVVALETISNKLGLFVKSSITFERLHKEISLFAMARALAARIAPSMLSSDFSNLSSEAARMMTAGADWLHMDVMVSACV